MSRIALEEYPIGTVLELTVPQWIFWSSTVIGVVQEMLLYPCVDNYIVIAYRTRRGKKKTLMYRPGFLDTMKQEKSARVLWTPPYAKNFRKTGDENPLVSFPKGTLIRRYTKNIWGKITGGTPPTYTEQDFWGNISIRPIVSGDFDPTVIGTEQISEYILPDWNRASFAGFPLPDLEDFLPIPIRQTSFTTEGLSLP